MIKQLIVGDTSHELAATRRILERLPDHGSLTRSR